MFVIIYGSFRVTLSMLNAPDMAKGKQSATKVLRLKDNVKEGKSQATVMDGDEQLSDEIASGDIEFHNVWFKYPFMQDDQWVLRNFNLKIKAGECIGLVGESGCGKSTITQLLYRFYDPQEGHITIGGRKLKDFTLRSLRSYFGIVHQEPLLFRTSIYENIRYGKPHATAEEIRQAARIANADEFISKEEFEGDSKDNDLVHQEEDDNGSELNKLPAGYKALCGSKGSKLSGGQKQRIAIARAIVRDPKVLILDEATSALDENSQKVVQDALNKVIKKRTSIVIAHRLSTLAQCDRVIRMEQGVVIG